MNYNLGSRDITLEDLSTRVNDGRFHTVRFSRNGVNATLQVDDASPQNKFPDGEE